LTSMAALERRAASLGAPLDAAQGAAFELYRRELLDWNRRVNLTAITDPDEIEVRHFVDSVSCLAAFGDQLSVKPDAAVIDVGSGAGLPGLPLKLVRPTMRLALLESVRKKTAFLEHMVNRLDLKDVTVLTGRAEDLSHSAAHRERYDIALSRGLAALPVLLELCLPFVRLGGRLIASRRGDLPGQQAEAERAVRELGGQFLKPIPVDLGPGYEDYGLVVVEKTAPTPERYPRRTGIPAKRPIA
jgi:16S rRNA (guanine527-N7)-methyltransferase